MSVWQDSTCHTICVRMQVGEFAFVLLSLATSSGLITSRLSMFLLGVTAISLLTTPIVFTIAHYVLPRETAACLPLSSPSVKRMTSLDGPPGPSAHHGSNGRSNGRNGSSSGPPSSKGIAHLRPRAPSGNVAEQTDSEALSPWVGLADRWSGIGELPLSRPALQRRCSLGHGEAAASHRTRHRPATQESGVNDLLLQHARCDGESMHAGLDAAQPDGSIADDSAPAAQRDGGTLDRRHVGSLSFG